MKILIPLIVLSFPGLLPAQFLISNFDLISSQAYLPFNDTWGAPTEQFVQHGGYISVTSVGGGDPTGEGSFHANIAGSLDGGNPVDLTGFTHLSLRARVDTGNASGFTVVLVRDSLFEIIGTAQFLTSSFGETEFATVTASFDLTGAGLVTDAAYWTIAGDGLSGSYRLSLDNLSATVPEPSACLLFAVGLTSLFLRRKPATNRPQLSRNRSSSKTQM